MRCVRPINTTARRPRNVRVLSYPDNIKRVFVLLFISITSHHFYFNLCFLALRSLIRQSRAEGTNLKFFFTFYSLFNPCPWSSPATSRPTTPGIDLNLRSSTRPSTTFTLLPCNYVIFTSTTSPETRDLIRLRIFWIRLLWR